MYAVLTELLEQVFPWVTEAQEDFHSNSEIDIKLAEKHLTARAFLDLMDELQYVDTPTMIIPCPDRANHGLFKLAVSQSQAFVQIMNGMREHLESSRAPYNASIDEVLPGIHQQMDAIGSDVCLTV